ncbi:serine/threonine-protein kinase [Lacinutrix mariniflava]|uniref:serine/threonine-protein kinase n=1 Tax=Lacinutrix mariniflava TaxID=342955 RepID=UPI0006E33629|nr:serine/threonine-protein kinase [Lacinutrix mariniflava]
MIKSISSITDISVINQNNENDILSFSKIEFDDNALGSGGFGSVHNVQTIDGVSKSEFVLKIFTDEAHKQHAYDVVKILHDKLKKHQEKTKTPTYHDIPELLGLPFLVFKGYDAISDKHCVAFLMYNLEKLNYEDYGSDTASLEDYKSLSIPDKLYLGYQLAKTIDFLHQIEFIHADLSENSLWFNAKRVQLAIIDYDSGFHFDTQGKPTTVGKVGHWIGRRFRNIIGQKNDSSDLTTLDRLYEEYWVLANATFEVIFGVMPFFFLSDTDDNTKQSYLKEFEWPNIDYASPLLNKQNTQQHQTIISFIEQLENAGVKELITAFKTVFNKGYKNESKRLTAKQWKDLLLDLNKSVDNIPLIKSFSSNKTTINRKNEDVIFSFDLHKFNALYINNILIPIHQKEISLPIEDEAKITFRAVNDFQVVEDFIEIKAIKVDPQILKFEASNYYRDSLSPINLNWSVENAKDVVLSEMQTSFPISSNTDVEPLTKTTYKLTANGFFDEIITKELTVDVIVPIIKSFKWEVNLSEGIDNVDLKWETEEAQSIQIIPDVRSNRPSGLAHVPINKETTFKLIAKGLFSEVEKEITAHPFPVPIVKQIFAEAPKIEINANIDFSESNLPKELFAISNVQFTNNVSFNNLEIDSTELKNTLEFPKFEDENTLINKFSKKKITLSDVYDSILNTIQNRLNK